jgi:hypothetical protein
VTSQRLSKRQIDPGVERGKIEVLPFADDDPKTAEVLSKTLVLVHDTEVKDPNILDQLKWRGLVAG